MKWLFLLNAFIESLAGLAFLFYPDISNYIPGLNYPATGAILLIKMYGVSALSLGMLSLLFYRQEKHKSFQLLGFGFFALFHLALGAVLLLYSLDLRPGIFHLGLGLAFTLGWGIHRQNPAPAVNA